jgi:hypothetical protein
LEIRQNIFFETIQTDKHAPHSDDEDANDKTGEGAGKKMFLKIISNKIRFFIDNDE